MFEFTEQHWTKKSLDNILQPASVKLSGSRNFSKTQLGDFHKDLGFLMIYVEFKHKVTLLETSHVLNQQCGLWFYMAKL